MPFPFAYDVKYYTSFLGFPLLVASEFWSVENGFPNLIVVRGQVNFKGSFQMISKLSLLHNCANEESYFYLISCFHTRSSSAARGDLII